jgi:hypothetical protein
MSSDNGVYIIQYKENDYRVSLDSAIDNIDYYPRNTDDWKRTIIDYFGSSSSYKTYEEAMSAAFIIESDMSKDSGYTEYGTCFLGNYRIDFKEIQRRETISDILNP